MGSGCSARAAFCGACVASQSSSSQKGVRQPSEAQPGLAPFEETRFLPAPVPRFLERRASGGRAGEDGRMGE